MPESQMLGSEGQGFSIAMKGLNGGRANIGISMRSHDVFLLILCRIPGSLQ